jgi:hypothetical protein
MRFGNDDNLAGAHRRCVIARKYILPTLPLSLSEKSRSLGVTQQ